MTRTEAKVIVRILQHLPSSFRGIQLIVEPPNPVITAVFLLIGHEEPTVGETADFLVERMTKHFNLE